MAQTREFFHSNFKDLLVWQKAMDLAVAIYRASEKLPKAEIHSLSAQLRLAAVKVPSKIAEGTAQEEEGNYIVSLQTAQGGLAELETLLIICQRLKFLDKNQVEGLQEAVTKVSQLLRELEAKLAAEGKATKVIQLKPNLRLLPTDIEDHA